MRILIVDILPDEITQHLQLFLLERPGWTQERIICSALSLFLLQNGVCDQAVSEVYLQAMFPSRVPKRGES
ncbi:MAG: DUF2811 domain-containing protein [Cyanobacteria bacterium P01_F01_bin.53]